MNARFKTMTPMVSASAAILLFLGACGVNTPDPQPEPFPDPAPDPVNTNGMDPDPVDPDPVDTNGVDPVAEPGPSDVIGVWRVVEEYGFANHLDYDLTYVQFAKDGVAMLFARDETTKAKECRDADYRVLGETGITFQTYDESLEVLIHRFDGFDTLLLTDQRGTQLTLKREAFVPTEYTCLTLNEVDRIETELTWRGRGELEADNDAFWFNIGPPNEIAMVSTLGVVAEPVPAPNSLAPRRLVWVAFGGQPPDPWHFSLFGRPTGVQNGAASPDGSRWRACRNGP